MKRDVLLSKSRLMAARQCPKRLYLEVHRPELKIVSAATEAAFRKGHVIGDMARRIYATDDAVYLPYEMGLKAAIAKSRRLLSGQARVPVFEATLQYKGVLVRMDVLLPDNAIGGWQLLEVKASTAVKPEHAIDCAIQAWVLQRSGYDMSSVKLVHVDTSFVYQGNGDFAGMLHEETLDEDVAALLPSVAEWATEAKAVLRGETPEPGVGKHCYTPYECPFTKHCWPSHSDYPIAGLGGGATHAKLGELVGLGYHDVREVPADRLNETQRRIQRVTRSGEAELLPGAAAFVAKLGYPRYYLDVETAMPEVPLWAGTRPYQTIPFQWSCHIEQQPGELQHAEFLDLTGDLPLRRFTESLLRVTGNSGPVIVYSSYERRIINDCIALFPDLAATLEALRERLIDLLPVAKEFYYHPAMHGSWSIKAVLPTVAPELRYAQADGIADGTAASAAWLEAIDPATVGERRDTLRRQLLDYCRLDTMAMVRLCKFFAGSG